MEGMSAGGGATSAAPASSPSVTPESTSQSSSGSKASQDGTQSTTPQSAQTKPQTAPQGAPKASDGAGKGKEGTLSQAQAKELAEADLDSVVKMPVNGKIVTVSVREALKHFGLDKTAYQKMQAASAQMKEVEEDRKLAKTNQKEWLKRQGLNPREVAERMLLEDLEYEAMSDEQRELQALKADKAEREKHEKAWKEQQENEAKAKEHLELTTKLQDQVVVAWQQTGLPPDPIFGKWIAATRIAALDQGLNWTVEQCAAKVKENYLSSTSAVLSQMTDIEAIRQVIPESVIKLLREHDIQRVTGQKAPKVGSGNSNRPGGSPASAKNQSGKKSLSESEWNEYFTTL